MYAWVAEDRRRELTDALLSLLALSVGFSILYSKRGFLFVNEYVVQRMLSLFPAVVVILLFAFLGHEFMHRYVARRLGYVAYYRASYPWLLLAILLPLFTNFIFAAPGAVVISYKIYGFPDEKRDTFLISAAGPSLNLLLAIVALAILPLRLPYLYLFGSLNAWLALFNLLPIPPLDGYKMAVSRPVYWGLALLLSLLVMWGYWAR